jgi:spore germination cell wall hydrolase CwlJ-like protein
MYSRLFGTVSLPRFAWAAPHWRRGVRVFWHRTDKAVWVSILVIAGIVTLFAFALRAAFADRELKQHLAREQHAQNLACLALNVYYEARGEPAAGQYAVAEVTMNRKASQRYPDTVCAVVYQRSWDPLRRRYVAAFSWTELGDLDEPGGEAWQRAKQVAEAVYYQKHTPALEGALFFHATYVSPEWAKDKRRVARIGRHVFYK